MMKIRSEYRLRELAGEHVVVVPAADGTADLTRIVSLNESAVYLWERFHGVEFSEEELARALADRYEVDPERARHDARNWIDRLAACGIVEA